MKDRILIKYKSIFKYEEHQETLKYQGQGIVISKNNGIKIQFEDKGIHFDLFLSEEKSVLKNNDNTIELIMNKETKNSYNTPYGTCDVNCILKAINLSGDYKIIYDIVSGQEIISTVYIIISLIITEGNHEA